jgi:hypothetical protein
MLDICAHIHTHHAHPQHYTPIPHPPTPISHSPSLTLSLLPTNTPNLVPFDGTDPNDRLDFVPFYWFSSSFDFVPYERAHVKAEVVAELVTAPLLPLELFLKLREQIHFRDREKESLYPRLSYKK